MLVVVLSGLALGNPVPDLASGFVELGWWVVPCEDVLAIPDLAAAREAEGAGVAVCVRNHTPDLEVIQGTVVAAVPSVEWRDIFQLIHVGEATLDGHRFQALLIPMTGALILSFEPIEPD